MNALKSTSQAPRAIAFLALLSALLLLPSFGSSAAADMSVNGFFPADFVKNDVFSGKGEFKRGEYRSAAKTVSVTPAANAIQPIQRLRPRSGRFAKTTKGTHRSDVQQSEFDVSPIIPTN